jgi:hypothetical protein
MNDRHTVDSLTSDALDALYERLEAAEDTESQRQLAAAREALASATIRATRAEVERDGAYRERAHLVAYAAALHPSHIGYTDPAAIDWLVVTIETPTGQMSWHIAERDRDLFEHVRLVPAVHNVWDGHTTEEKYARLRRLTASPGRAEAAIASVRAAVHIADDEDVTDWQRGYRACAVNALAALDQPAPGRAATEATEPHTGLVVQPYRNDRGENAWVFRCWGTDDGCDGWLSLDHYSEQSAERARDRHVAEEHGAPGPAATEEQDLVHALGGDRTAQTIAHTLTVHGHTLNAVRTMTYAELLAVPGIGGTSLARIRAALDGVPEPDAAAATRPGEAAIARVRVLHRRNENTGECEYCSARDYPTYAVPHPCDTVRALDGQEQPS